MLRQRRAGRASIYDYLQTNLAYSSNRITSNRLTLNQVEFLYNKDNVLVTTEKMKLNDFIPIIIDDKHGSDYLNGIAQWDNDRLPFMELCITAQFHFQAHQELDHLLEIHARMMKV